MNFDPRTSLELQRVPNRRKILLSSAHELLTVEPPVFSTTSSSVKRALTPAGFVMRHNWKEQAPTSVAKLHKDDSGTKNLLKERND